MRRAAPFTALLLTTISLAALTACGSSDSRSAKSDAPMPPISEMDAAMNEPAPQQTLSGSDTLTPVMPVAAGITGTGNVEERMAKLEASVNSLRTDYDRIMPAFATLNTTNDRIQKLLVEIEKETGIRPDQAAVTETETTTIRTIPAPSVNASAPPVTGTAPAAGTVSKATTVYTSKTPSATTTDVTTTTTTTETVSAPPLSAFTEQPTVEEAKAEAARQAAMNTTAAPATKATASSGSTTGSGPNAVKGVRIGEHGSKTRLVFDLGNNTKPEVKYDVAGETLTVDMPATAWSGNASGKPKSPLIESWSAAEGASGGSTMEVRLKKNARVVSTEFLKAEGGNGARLVMDIAAGG